MTLLLLFPFLWLGGWIAASIWFRRRNGKPIIPRAPRDAVFYENGCSGRSLRSVITQLGGAQNCLLVYISGHELVVTPIFPFTLIFLPEIFGLDIRVPLTAVQSVEPTRTFFRRALRITFSGGRFAPLELRLHDEQGFISQLGSHVAVSGDRKVAVRSKVRRRYRLAFMRIFLAIWGLGGLVAAFSGLPDDLRFRRDGVRITGVFDGHTGVAGDRNDNGILSYVVDGHRYHLTSLQGAGIYKVGNTANIFYLPADPSQAREATYLPFDLLWLALGTAALLFALLGGLLFSRRSK